MTKTFAKGVLTAAFVAALGGTALAEIGSHTIRFASANSPGHPQVIGMERFAELVAEKSGGQMTVQLFPGGQLGGDVQTISALQGGIVQMTVMNASILSGNIPAFGSVDLPFLFNSGEEADQVMDGAFGQSLIDMLPDQSLVGLGFWELGFRNLTNNARAVNTVEDIAGLRIRTVQAPIPIELFNALGANAVPLPYTELYTALETGTVDGQENPVANILNARFYEVQDHLTMTRHQYNPQIVMVSQRFWDGLNEEEQAVLREAEAEARVYQRQVSRDQEDEALAEVSQHMEVVELAPEEVERLREAVAPLNERFRAEIGEEVVDRLMAEIESVRN